MLVVRAGPASLAYLSLQPRGVRWRLEIYRQCSPTSPSRSELAGTKGLVEARDRGTTCPHPGRRACTEACQDTRWHLHRWHPPSELREKIAPRLERVPACPGWFLTSCRRRGAWDSGGPRLRDPSGLLHIH